MYTRHELFKLEVSRKIDQYKADQIINTMSTDELISHINKLNGMLYCKIPVYYRLSKRSKDKQFSTTYNAIGMPIAVNVPMHMVNDLQHVKTHRLFIFAGSNERLLVKMLMAKLANKLGLKTFKNGKLHISAIKALNKLGIN